MDAQKAYKEALKLAKADFHQREESGLDPYLNSLDEFLASAHVIKESAIEKKEIFTSLIIGTKSASRASSFAHNFMPLLEPSSEFGIKWTNLYASQCQEGMRDAIECVEIFGRYFVQEGNKRVSVAKFLKAPMILARIRHLEIEAGESKLAKTYQAYLAFQKKSGLDSMLLSSKKKYDRLTSLLKFEAEITAEQKENLISLWRSFWSAYEKLDLKHPKLIGDAFLIYLETFGLPASPRPVSQIEMELESIESKLVDDQKDDVIKLLSNTETSDNNSLFSLFLTPLKVAMILAGDEHILWSDGHRKALEKIEEEAKIKEPSEIFIFNNINDPQACEQAIEEAIRKHANVIFTTHPFMLQITNTFAAKYPNIKFLNCSLNTSTSSLRTYYIREFEALFLMGLAAGVLSKSGIIGYIGDYPIFGEKAKIDAFAIGVSMTNPQAKIYLDWSTTTKSSEYIPRGMDLLYIGGQEFDLDIRERKKYGLFDISKDGYKRIACIHADWSIFYTQILASIMNHTYSKDGGPKNQGLSYWWGLSNKILSVEFDEGLPANLMRLVRFFEKALEKEQFYIFTNESPGFEGFEQKDDHIPLKELFNLKILAPNVYGNFPSFSEVNEEIKDLVLGHGIERLKPGPNDDKEQSQDKAKSSSLSAAGKSDPDPDPDPKSLPQQGPLKEDEKQIEEYADLQKGDERDG